MASWSLGVVMSALHALSCAGMEDPSFSAAATNPLTLQLEVLAAPDAPATTGAILLLLTRVDSAPASECPHTVELCASEGVTALALPAGVCAGWYRVTANLASGADCANGLPGPACAFEAGPAPYFLGIGSDPLALRCAPSTSATFDVNLR